MAESSAAVPFAMEVLLSASIPPAEAPTPRWRRSVEPSLRAPGWCDAACCICSPGAQSIVARRYLTYRVLLMQPQARPHHFAAGAEAARSDPLIDEAALVLVQRDSQTVCAWNVPPTHKIT